MGGGWVGGGWGAEGAVGTDFSRFCQISLRSLLNLFFPFCVFEDEGGSKILLVGVGVGGGGWLVFSLEF